MQRRIASAQDLSDITNELSRFIGHELGVSFDASADNAVDVILNLWAGIQQLDPDPEPNIGAYIGNNRLAEIAEAVIEAAG